MMIEIENVILSLGIGIVGNAQFLFLTVQLVIGEIKSYSLLKFLGSLFGKQIDSCDSNLFSQFVDGYNATISQDHDLYLEMIL